ncbi:SatD family protein [Zunongwangia sp.]|uniref:SatD family protein n=1 Tax=Zunongwangia sp. TaxID=1965325 RepID=UPI003AA9DE82
MIAVLTADLIDSTKYSNSFLEIVLSNLKNEFSRIEENFSEQTTSFDIFRGDSIQAIIKKPSKALWVALVLKSTLNAIVNDTEKNAKTDLKLAIGIGNYQLEREEIRESNGEAFHFSGRTLDEMKNTGRKLMLATPNSEVNEEFNISLAMFDYIAERWSVASAEVVYYLLHGYKEIEISKKLNISQSAVNQRKKTAGWEVIDLLLTRFEKKISATFIEKL